MAQSNSSSRAERFRRNVTRCGGLFLFAPDSVRLGIETMADTARLHGSKMIPRTHALRACLALNLWAIERNSHVMALVAEEGLGAVLRTQPHPEEELSQRVRLAHHESR